MPATTRPPCPTSTAPASLARPGAPGGEQKSEHARSCCSGRPAAAAQLIDALAALGRAVTVGCGDPQRRAMRPHDFRILTAMLHLSRLALDPDGHEYQDTYDTGSVRAGSLYRRIRPLVLIS